MAPILSFLAEETYSYLPGDKEESIFLVDFPSKNEDWQKAGLEEKFDALLEVRSEASKILEGLRREKTIGSSLEAKVLITANDQKLSVLKDYEQDLADFFIVSQVELKAGDEFKVAAEKATGDKCPRCWKVKTDIGSNDSHKDICGSCAEAVS